MKTEWFKEYSDCLLRDMEFKVYGHAGRRKRRTGALYRAGKQVLPHDAGKYRRNKHEGARLKTFHNRSARRQVHG